MVSSLATKVHRTLHHIETDESMVRPFIGSMFVNVKDIGSQIPLFDVEPHDGSKRSQKFIMGKRNWCGVRWDGQTGDLVFTLFIEKEKGGGQTKGYEIISLKKADHSFHDRYTVRSPPPRWSSTQ